MWGGFESDFWQIGTRFIVEMTFIPKFTDLRCSQCWSIPIIADQCRSMIINADQWSMPDWHWSELIGIDQNWSALRGISDQCQDFDRHCSALGIDRGSPAKCLSLCQRVYTFCQSATPLTTRNFEYPESGYIPKTSFFMNPNVFQK